MQEQTAAIAAAFFRFLRQPNRPSAPRRCDAAICPESGHKRKCAARVRSDVNDAIRKCRVHRSRLSGLPLLPTLRSPEVTARITSKKLGQCAIPLAIWTKTTDLPGGAKTRTARITDHYRTVGEIGGVFDFPSDILMDIIQLTPIDSRYRMTLQTLRSGLDCSSAVPAEA
jgi:hypothetical protein